VQHQPVLRRPDPVAGPPLVLQCPSGQRDQVGVVLVQPGRHHRYFRLQGVDVPLTLDHSGGKAHTLIVHLFEPRLKHYPHEFSCTA